MTDEVAAAEAEGVEYSLEVEGVVLVFLFFFGGGGDCGVAALLFEAEDREEADAVPWSFRLEEDLRTEAPRFAIVLIRCVRKVLGM